MLMSSVRHAEAEFDTAPRPDNRSRMRPSSPQSPPPPSISSASSPPRARGRARRARRATAPPAERRRPGHAEGAAASAAASTNVTARAWRATAPWRGSGASADTPTPPFERRPGPVKNRSGLPRLPSRKREVRTRGASPSAPCGRAAARSTRPGRRRCARGDEQSLAPQAHPGRVGREHSILREEVGGLVDLERALQALLLGVAQHLRHVRRLLEAEAAP